MAAPVIDKDTCLGCGACVDACPAGVLGLVDGVAAVVDEDSCLECGMCADECPAGAIELGA